MIATLQPAPSAAPSLRPLAASYDAENRVIRVDGESTATYQYDANVRRVHWAVGTAVFDYIYDAEGRIIGEIDATNSWNRIYIYLPRWRENEEFPKNTCHLIFTYNIYM